MSTQAALESKEKAPSESPILMEADKLFEEVKTLWQAIERRAYEFFEARGREDGRDLEDWLRAEALLTRPVPVEIKEDEKQIVVRAEVPGFKAGEITVSVEPRGLIIGGKTEVSKEEEIEKTVYSEHGVKQFCRALTLPAEVEPEASEATLRDGVLSLVLRKVPTTKAVAVEVKTP